MSNVLVGPHHDHATPVSTDAAHVEDILASLKVRTEHLLIVAKPVAALLGQKQGGHRLNGNVTMALLEDGPDIDDGVDVLARRRVSLDRR